VPISIMFFTLVELSIATLGTITVPSFVMGLTKLTYCSTWTPSVC
jgi:hypothetical protein